MIYTAFLERLTEHYADMALNPATLEHARYRVKQLKNDQTGMFKDLPEMVRQKIEEKKQIQTQGNQD